MLRTAPWSDVTLSSTSDSGSSTIERLKARCAETGVTYPEIEALGYGAPHFPSVHIDAHMRIADRMTLPETLDYMRMRHRQIEEAAVEIVLRTLQKVGPEIGRQLLEATEFGRWNVQLTQERIETELLRGQARRLRMSIIARDAERSLGKIARHERADEALDLLQSYLAEPSPAP